MCAKKKANFDFWLTIWLSFERRKIFLETVLQMLLICVCHFSCFREREREEGGAEGGTEKRRRRTSTQRLCTDFSVTRHINAIISADHGEDGGLLRESGFRICLTRLPCD